MFSWKTASIYEHICAFILIVLRIVFNKIHVLLTRRPSQNEILNIVVIDEVS
jgi:hypothetical protein